MASVILGNARQKPTETHLIPKLCPERFSYPLKQAERCNGSSCGVSLGALTRSSLTCRAVQNPQIDAAQTASTRVTARIPTLIGSVYTLL